MKRAFLFDFLGRDLRRARPHDEAEESFLGVIASLTALMAGLASLALMQPCSSAHNHTQCKHARTHQLNLCAINRLGSQAANKVKAINHQPYWLSVLLRRSQRGELVSCMICPPRFESDVGSDGARLRGPRFMPGAAQ